MNEQRTERLDARSGSATNTLLGLIVGMLSAVIALEVYRIYGARHRPDAKWQTRVVESNLPPLQQSVSSALVPGHRHPLQIGGSLSSTSTHAYDMHAQAKRLFDEARRRFGNIEQQFYGPAGSPFALDPPMQELEQRVTQLFEQVREDPHFRALPASDFDSSWKSVFPSPGIDVREMVSNYVVTVSLADFDKPEINLNIHGNRLTISAVSKTMSQSSDDNSASTASSYQRFRRSVRLPAPIEDPASVRATFKDGLLSVVIPHSNRQENPERKIEIH
ncbi:MAG: Hsp20/alpha crystallin family protein [Verrucomicrobia bacterium]|nr:Hsp20/alpha crystallin family protein [Verrucomicrobiota bacterium]MDA1085631.1 Hsp20/alpha crystallin family protein [Verrucomicrobiota bacterium]